jgi:hypothetical protein
MKMIYRKAASLTLLLSIWAGIIGVGVLAYPSGYKSTWDQIQTVYSNPVGAIPVIIKNAFSAGNLGMFGGLLVAGAVSAVIFTTSVLGGGFSQLFAIPLLIIFAVVNMFVLPTTQILSESGAPYAVQVIYTLFIGTLTILTALTFTSGRP